MGATHPAFEPTVLDQRKPVAQQIRAIFNAPDKSEAERCLLQAIERWRTKSPKLAQWAEENLPEGFAKFLLPASFLRLVSALLAECDEERMTGKIYLIHED